ncbi:MAG: hypothetical protein ABI321_09760 [Polyangia bacterium]
MRGAIRNFSSSHPNIARGAIIGWGVVVSIMCTYMLAPHVLALPVPSRNVARAVSTVEHRGDEQGRWLALHVLASGCGCSARVLDHLLASERPAGVVEKILWIGAPSPQLELARQKGFRVAYLTGEQLAAIYHVEAVPLYVVVDPAGSVRYTGGYTSRKQGPDPRDLEILASLRANHEVAALPLFGCAASHTLQRTLDPLVRLSDAFK